MTPSERHPLCYWQECHRFRQSWSIQSNKGNTIKKNADPEDPAVHVAREGNDVVKRAHELTVEKKADGGSKTDAKEEKEKPHDSKHEAKAGDKRKADAVDGAQNGDKADDKKKATPKKHDESPTKKQKKEAEKKASDDAKEQDNDAPKKGRGRPKKASGTTNTTKTQKKREPKKAATANGELRRSARHKA